MKRIPFVLLVLVTGLVLSMFSTGCATANPNAQMNEVKLAYIAGVGARVALSHNDRAIDKRTADAIGAGLTALAQGDNGTALTYGIFNAWLADNIDPEYVDVAAAVVALLPSMLNTDSVLDAHARQVLAAFGTGLLGYTATPPAPECTSTAE